jgi:hypothetical protein
VISCDKILRKEESGLLQRTVTVIVADRHAETFGIGNKNRGEAWGSLKNEG